MFLHERQAPAYKFALKYPYAIGVPMVGDCRPDEYLPTSLNDFARMPWPHLLIAVWHFSTKEDLEEFKIRRTGSVKFVTQKRSPA